MSALPNTGHSRSVFVKSISGIGEETTIGGLAYRPESPEGMKLAIDTYITPILLQSDPNRVGPTMGAINKAVQGNVSKDVS